MVKYRFLSLRTHLEINKKNHDAVQPFLGVKGKKAKARVRNKLQNTPHESSSEPIKSVPL